MQMRYMNLPVHGYPFSLHSGGTVMKLQTRAAAVTMRVRVKRVLTLLILDLIGQLMRTATVQLILIKIKVLLSSRLISGIMVKEPKQMYYLQIHRTRRGMVSLLSEGSKRRSQRLGDFSMQVDSLVFQPQRSYCWGGRVFSQAISFSTYLAQEQSPKSGVNILLLQRKQGEGFHINISFLLRTIAGIKMSPQYHTHVGMSMIYSKADRREDTPQMANTTISDQALNLSPPIQFRYISEQLKNPLPRKPRAQKQICTRKELKGYTRAASPLTRKTPTAH